MQVKEKAHSAFNSLKDKFKWKNAFQAPRLQKVVISTGVGRLRKDKAKIDIVKDRLAKISGQKVAARAAKISVASFKLREGETVGYMTTLRNKNMYNFLDRLLNIALPRSRDFRGIKRSAVDEMGNLTIGIREHTIFPEVSDEEVSNVFSFSVTIVSTAKNTKEALAFYENIGVPFERLK